MLLKAVNVKLADDSFKLDTEATYKVHKNHFGLSSRMKPLFQYLKPDYSSGAGLLHRMNKTK